MKTTTNKIWIMTILSLTFLMASLYKCNAQDKRFAIFGYTDPVATYKDGFNIGGGIEYQMTIMYFKAQAFVFPNLRGKKYIELTGTPLGFNQHLAMDRLRLYEGFKVGVIKRDVVHPTVGLEAGIEYYFNAYNDGFYVGLGNSYDYRVDGQEEDPDIKDYWRFSGLFKVGFTF